MTSNEAKKAIKGALYVRGYDTKKLSESCGADEMEIIEAVGGVKLPSLELAVRMAELLYVCEFVFRYWLYAAYGGEV
jgi:hypothetical protein